MIKIDKKITAYKLVSASSEPVTIPPVEDSSSRDEIKALTAKLARLSAPPSRPERLVGVTYKIKPPMAEHALYVTINDAILNEGTPEEHHRPFEIFINSKDVEHYQWIVALTRVISAVFRKGGDVTFLVEELFSVFDPKGGYMKKGGLFVPGLVAEIGLVIKNHLISIGMLEDPSLDEYQKALVESKKEEYIAKTGEDLSNGFPSTAVNCSKCNYKSVILMDGCQTCLNCGDSKCG